MHKRHLWRARQKDRNLPLLINHFLERLSWKKATCTIPAKLMSQLVAYHCPGNIRELQNAIERYMTFKEIGFLKPCQPSNDSSSDTYPDFAGHKDLQSSVEAFEKHYIIQCLKATNWHQGKASALFKINRKTLYKKMQYYELKKKLYSKQHHIILRR
jgi:DNA-binding NtrC family response regulator